MWTTCAAPHYLHSHQWVTHMDDERQVLVFERGPLVFVFNWSPHKDYEGLKVGAGRLLLTGWTLYEEHVE